MAHVKTRGEKIATKLRKVSVPGKQGKNSPTSKSDMIRKLHARNMSTGDIKKKLENVGLTVHYSEIYGAVERTTAVA